nr:non-ribosomal peptide synthetase 6 [Streptomyces sp.]
MRARGSQRFPGYPAPADSTGRFLSFDGNRASLYEGAEPLTPGHRYRTGDRAAWADGAFVRLGRLDHQLTIRGYRVGFGEIGSALLAQAGVTEAAVVALHGLGAQQAGCRARSPASCSARTCRAVSSTVWNTESSSRPRRQTHWEKTSKDGCQSIRRSCPRRSS